MTITGIRQPHVSGKGIATGVADHVDCIVKLAFGQKVFLSHHDTLCCMIHAEDLTRVSASVAVAKSAKHSLYNTGREVMSLADIAEMIHKVIPDAAIDIEVKPGHEGRTGTCQFDDARLKAGLVVQHMLYRQRVAQMIERIRSGAAMA